MGTSRRTAGHLFVIGALWLCVRVAPAYGQHGYDAWSIEDGLPQNSVNDITQTRDGYLWLATYGGLVRFDGTRFVVFDRSVDGIDSIRVRTLHEDPTGTLWAATDDGMVLRYRDGRFATFGRAAGLPVDAALRIETDRAGNLWITWTRAMTKFDGRTFETFEPQAFDRGVTLRAHLVQHYGSHSTWWSRDRDGVHCLFAGVVTTCLTPDAAVDDVVGVSTEPSGALWIRFRTAGVMRIHGNERRTFAVPARAGRPHMFFTDRSGRFWSYGQGGIVQRLDTNATISVSAAWVLSMYEDREGSVWAGTTEGLRRLRTTSIAVRSTADGLSSNNVYAILRQRSGDVWVGTWGGGLNRMAGGQVRSYRAADGLPSDNVTTLFEDSTGRLWVGTTLGLVYRDGDRFVRHQAAEGVTSAAVWAMHEDPSGDLWFATDRGLVRQHNDRYVRYTTSDGLPHDRVLSLAGDSRGGLWIGTAQGLGRYDGTRFEALAGAQGLVGNHVRSIYEDADGIVWIGTYDGGLYRWRTGHLTRYTTHEGLLENGIFQILEDHNGYFWMGSNRGIQRVARAALNAFADGHARSIPATAYGLQDGMTSLECNGGRQPSGLRMPDGTLWIPTQGGIAIVDPRAVGPRPDPPPVRIEELRFRGNPIAFAGGLTVPAGRNTLEVHYTAISFVKPEQVRFRYRLAGQDDDWVEAGAMRSVAYSGLPSGTYEFIVTAANGDGAWHASGDRVTIVVNAPFWQRGWFLATAIVTVLSLVHLIERRRVNRLRRAHARQQAFARQLLETQEAERRRISHELHDSLGQTLFLIRQRARAAIARSNTADAPDQALGEIVELATAAYGEMKDVAYALRPYELDRIGLSRTLKGMLQRVASACQLQVTEDIDDVDRLLSPEAASHVFRIVQEALHNVVRHAAARQVRVSVTCGDDRLEIEVADDGRGFPPGGPGDRDETAGAGLASIRERARALNGTLVIDSRPHQGTRLIVECPLRRSVA
jgi:signal transduction histidine kinase/ligand-binding sensor domain-containing protein